QTFDSVHDLVNGLKFSINSLSSSSGDVIRDLNLKDYFFNYLTQNFKINGIFGEPANDSIDVTFDIFGQPKIIRLAFLNYTTSDISAVNQIIEIKGSISLKSMFGAVKAFNSLHEKCYDLHKGSDGISKTWEQVDIYIKAHINSSFNKISNHQNF
ncbi:uncharacterized protein METZ01_LOCUS322414, partial [marine metagenome]